MANILEIAAGANEQFRRNMEYLNGYKSFTTFYGDFTIADFYGADAVRDTFKRAFTEWRHDYKYLTEFILVLNHKIWEHYGGGPEDEKSNQELAAVYNELWQAADDWAANNLKGDELDYYYQITD